MLVTALSLTCKLGVGATYGIGLIYAQEIFPTNIRATCLGLAAGSGFIGSILAPFSVYLFRIINWAPGVIFGLLALVAGLLTLLLPETYHRPLPTSVEEIAGWSRTDDKRSTKSRASDAEKHITVSTIIPDTFAQDEETRKEPLGETNMAYSGHTHDE
ncbi:Solute carrier family 22 member 16, partial [Lamellibrachia satsuma]